MYVGKCIFILQSLNKCIFTKKNTDDEKYKIQCKYNNRKLRDVGNEAGELIRWLAKLCRGRRRAPP